MINEEQQAWLFIGFVFLIGVVLGVILLATLDPSAVFPSEVSFTFDFATDQGVKLPANVSVKLDGVLKDADYICKLKK